MLASRSVAEGRNGAFGGVQPAAKRCAARLQTEPQREWRFDPPSVTSASAVTRRAGGGRAAACHGASVGHGGEATLPMIRLGFWSRRTFLILTQSKQFRNTETCHLAEVRNRVGRGLALSVSTMCVWDEGRIFLVGLPRASGRCGGRPGGRTWCRSLPVLSVSTGGTGRVGRNGGGGARTFCV